MDENKVFDLMEKIYIELQQTKKEIKVGFEDVNNKLNNVENDVKVLGAKIDGELIPKQDALFDGYTGNSEKLQEINEKIDDLKLDFNNLTIKTLKSENKIIELDKKIAK